MQSATLRRTLRATPEAVPEARRLAVEFVAGHCPESAEIQDSVALTVSEAVGNVVRHAYQDGRRGAVELEAQIHADSVLIAVRDEGAGLGGPSRRPGLGLGLRIMRAMAEARLEALPGGGCEVTLRFPCHS